jgi:hypothetical protein
MAYAQRAFGVAIVELWRRHRRQAQLLALRPQPVERVRRRSVFPLAVEQRQHPPRNPFYDPLEVLLLRFGQGPQIDPSLLVLGEDRIRHHRVEVGIGIEP